MGEDFLKGNLYGSVDGRTMLSWPDLEITRKIDTLSIDEQVKELLSTVSSNKGEGDITFNINSIDLIVNGAPEPWSPIDTFWFEHDTPIMIQARWHKKKRINKKWLKRYGMKSDVVKTRHKARALSYNTMYGDFEFKTIGKSEYILRPDQKRKHLKIEGL